jgi:hypothetical protein
MTKKSKKSVAFRVIITTVITLGIIFALGLGWAFKVVGYRIDKPIHISENDKQAILNEIGITLPNGAKFGKCYKNLAYQKLIVKIDDIKNIATALNENFIKENILDSYEKQKLGKWIIDSDELSTANPWFDASEDKNYEEESILNDFYYDDGTELQLNFGDHYGKHQGFEFTFPTKNSKVTSYVYKIDDTYTIIILKEDVDREFLKSL